MDYKKRVGKFLVKTVVNESFRAYIPPKLPPKPDLNMPILYEKLETAQTSIAKLNTIIDYIPNISLLNYINIRKEAVLSSQIEGTQSSISDLILFENNQKINISINDVEEVSSYVKALNYGLDRLNSGFPLCIRLLKEIHGVLLQNSRREKQTPGEIRRSQNWIGRTRPSNALYVPPPFELLPDLLSDFEKFLHDDKVKLPILIKIGLAHVQFETIHPFLDGNGRLGRLLIILLLYEYGLLDKPIMHVSLYLKENRTLYYNLLQEVRTDGLFENWLEFFLDSIIHSANTSKDMIDNINKLFKSDIEKINKLGKAKESALYLFNYLQKLPQISTSNIIENLDISPPTIRLAINNLKNLGILKEITNNHKNKIYIYKNYLDILEQNTQPL